MTKWQSLKDMKETLTQKGKVSFTLNKKFNLSSHYIVLYGSTLKREFGLWSLYIPMPILRNLFTLLDLLG